MSYIKDEYNINGKTYVEFLDNPGYLFRLRVQIHGVVVSTKEEILCDNCLHFHVAHMSTHRCQYCVTSNACTVYINKEES